MASRFLVSGGNGNWTSTSNWSATSGGGSGVSFPTVADTVTFDNASGATNITIDTAAQAALSWSVTSGYTGTITFTNSLSVSGSVTLGANMNFAGSAALILHATGTLTSSGKTAAIPLSIDAASTITLGDNCTFTGGLTLANAAIVINSNTLTIGGGITDNTITNSLTGTTTILLNGTGTMSMPSVTTGSLRNNLTINTAGTITFSGNFRYTTGTLTYTAGTIVGTGATLTMSAATLTVNASGFSIDTLMNASGTVTVNGTSGITLATLSQTIVGTIYNFKSGNTYNVTSSILLTGSSVNPNSILSSTGSSPTSINFTGNTSAIAYTAFTDINATGFCLYGYSGSTTRTTNIVTGTVIGPAKFPTLTSPILGP